MHCYGVEPGFFDLGADWINSAMKECLVGHPGKPTSTRGLAYKPLPRVKDIISGPGLREFVSVSAGQLLDGAGCGCWYFPFPSHLRGANEV